MSSPSSVSTWIQRLRAGDHAAAQPLWQRYHARLVELARQQLADPLQSAAEDVAAMAFAALAGAIQAGRYPDVSQRDDLWRLLLTITLNQARRLGRDATRQRRDARRTHLAADLFDLPEADLDRLASNEPDPALAVELNDQVRDLLQRLPGDLRPVGIDLVAGWSPAEIASRLNCSVRTVERRRERIRQFWLGPDLRDPELPE
jgi:RNA polymerase sigma factor (sigma-70 family)